MQAASESRDEYAMSLSSKPTVQVAVSPRLDFNVGGSARARAPLAATIKESAEGDTGVMMWKHGEGSYTQSRRDRKKMRSSRSWHDVEM